MAYFAPARDLWNTVSTLMMVRYLRLTEGPHHAKVPQVISSLQSTGRVICLSMPL